MNQNNANMIEIGETGPDWQAGENDKFFAQVMPAGAYAFGATESEARANLDAKISANDQAGAPAVFRMTFNQGARDCAAVAIADGRALCVYAMPAGRQFLFELPWSEATRAALSLDAEETWENLRAMHGEYWTPKTVAVKSAPVRWRDAIAKLKPVQHTCTSVGRWKNTKHCQCHSCARNRAERDQVQA